MTQMTMPDVTSLDPVKIFNRLPPTRCGDADRRYVNEVLDAGFGNESAVIGNGAFGDTENFGCDGDRLTITCVAFASDFDGNVRTNCKILQGGNGLGIRDLSQG